MRQFVKQPLPSLFFRLANVRANENVPTFPNDRFPRLNEAERNGYKNMSHASKK